MLDGILGRGFTVKCKSLIKTTRSRIDLVRRRADAKQRFLKEDLAKLLSNGLDINAYGRTEDFLAGKDLLSCYDFVEHSSEYILKQLSRMQKQGECPEECREAVASLMYAAARFSDLPELRELRDIFQQRYGNHLETFVNQKFVEKLSSRPPASERRLQVLQEIASEFSIKWDSRGFERRMATPSAAAQVGIQKVDIAKQRPGLLEGKKSRTRDYGEDNMLLAPERKETIEYKEKSVLRAGASRLHGDGVDLSPHERHKMTESKPSYPFEKVDGKPKVERSNISSHGQKNDNGVHVLNSIRKGVEDGSDRLKSCSSNALPPPYVISKDGTPRPPYIKPKEEDKHRYGRGSAHANFSKLDGHKIDSGCEDHLADPEKDLEKIPLPKPRSIRRKHHKSSTSDNAVDALEEDLGAIATKSASSRRKDHSRNGLQILFEDEHNRKEDEERMVDKLLIHYCKKPSSYDDEKLRRKKTRNQVNDDVGESSLDRSRDVVKAEVTRSVSLPQDHPISTQTKKVFTRANTMEPDHTQARHVHPKLPDYDDLAARFAALKGR
ncbi:hypothetical protein CASFOL_021647 [Castilleja foliolosa]|uniref:Vacuolar protein sorting-associated protein Ist1 n=1 Tax=Castilleja foliolosa TaxID=1961234 RepID=A0ABD3CXZ9_9LAMI